MMLLRPAGLLGRYELPFLRQVQPAPKVEGAQATEEVTA
jgi:hypothetical protein